jgi:hypothetical protein
MNQLLGRPRFFLVAFVICAHSLFAQTTVNVLTWHNDIYRSGQNVQEHILTPASVNPTVFGKIFSYPVDGMIYAQPLYVQGVTIPGKGVHNVVFVATENDSVYAFDGDSAKTNPDPLWHVNFTGPPNVIPVPCLDNQKNCNVYPIIGITGTPVINLRNNSLYVVVRTLELDQNNQPNYFVRLHVLDITTGAEKPRGPAVICGALSGQVCSFPPYRQDQSTFDPQREMQRPALLLMPAGMSPHQVLYIAFGNHRGWVFAYDSETLELLAAFCTGPDLHKSKGSNGIWGSGGGIAGDSLGNVYVTTADGPFDAQQGGADYGDTLLKLTLVQQNPPVPPRYRFSVTDYFTPANFACLQADDLDLSSGSPVVLSHQPGSHPHEILVAGKSNVVCNPNGGPINVVDHDIMGQVNGPVQAVNGSLGGYFASGAYWNGPHGGTYVYYAGADQTALEPGGAAIGDSLRLYMIRDGVFSPTSSISQSSDMFLNGATPSISSNGKKNGIVWLVERRDRLVTKPGSLPAFLHAYNARNVSKELYSSEMNPTRDAAGPATKFVVPTIANGKVYVGTQTELDVYGRCPCPQ